MMAIHNVLEVEMGNAEVEQGRTIHDETYATFVIES